MLLQSILILGLSLGTAWGNVEKIIFTASKATALPKDASIDNLLLIPLNPQHSTVRTYLNASFPSEINPKGTESWLLLEGLTPGQRYEARICWLATQPTSFWLYTHSMYASFETPSLITSLSSYAYARRSLMDQSQIQHLHIRKRHTNTQSTISSTMFLQIYAAADYYSLNKTLMRNVPPVLVDIILDPYLLNIFPRSLIPTAIYIILIAFVAWFLSAWIFKRLHKLLLKQPVHQPTPSKSKREE